MNIRALARTFLLVLICLGVVFLTSCLDMGGYDMEELGDEELSDHEFSEYYKPYFNCYGEINMLDQELDDHKFDLEESFFNKRCTDELRNWSDDEDCVPTDEYCYFTIEVKKDMEIDSISMYLKGKDLEGEAKLEIYLYAVNADGLKTNGDYATYDIWKLEKEKDEDERRELSDFEDLKLEDAISSTTMKLANTWESFSVSFYEKGSSENATPRSFTKGQKIVLLFKNNLGYGLEAGLDKLSFSATNLIIRMHDDD